jgi:hypothetical protein
MTVPARDKRSPLPWSEVKTQAFETSILKRFIDRSGTRYYPSKRRATSLPWRKNSMNSKCNSRTVDCRLLLISNTSIWCMIRCASLTSFTVHHAWAHISRQCPLYDDWKVMYTPLWRWKLEFDSFLTSLNQDERRKHLDTTRARREKQREKDHVKRERITEIRNHIDHRLHQAERGEEL